MRNSGKILVVEDSFAVKKRLMMALENNGFRIETAANGREAWTKTRRQRYDFIITDEQMPIMSGQELCRRLSEDKRSAGTPIIFLTSAREKLNLDELSNVSAVFDKPFNPTLLVNYIDAYNSQPNANEKSVVGRTDATSSVPK